MSKSAAEVLAENPRCLDKLEVVIQWRSKRIDICWPKHRGKTPYSIGFDRAQTLADIMRWMAHLSGKVWFHGTVAQDLGKALIEVYNK